MIITEVNEVYNADNRSVVARGLLYSEEEVSTTLLPRVSHFLWDISGQRDVKAMLNQVATTSFGTGLLTELLDHTPEPEDWRVGEAMAEAYLTDCRNCSFPWPTWRDMKNPESSPAGTDLVGFQNTNGEDRFAFAEIKTSQEMRWPPGVLHGRHGLAKQLEGLRDSNEIKNPLVRYLAYRANGASWYSVFMNAATRYFQDPCDVSLFGILIRDVEPKKEDLVSRASVLSDNCPDATSIELRALYLPLGSIQAFVDQIKSVKGSQT